MTREERPDCNILRVDLYLLITVVVDTARSRSPEKIDNSRGGRRLLSDKENIGNFGSQPREGTANLLIEEYTAR